MKKEKTIHELGKEFPNKTYTELEKYRDADRVEEAIGIGHNQPPEEEQGLKNEVGACITAGMKRDKAATELQVIRRRAQEAEGELSILKGIETNRVKEAHTRCDHLQVELDRVKKENNDLFNRIADSLEVDESHQKLNGKLQERLTELEEENKKMHAKLDERIDSMRKAGM